MRNDKDEKDDVRHDLEDGEKEMGDRRMKRGLGLVQLKRKVSGIKHTEIEAL